MPAAMLICSYTLLDRNAHIVALVMVEGTKIRPYHFKPTDVSGYGDEEEKSSKLETDIREEANFTKHLGTTDWCGCTKCSPMLIVL